MKKNVLVFPCGSEIGLEIHKSLNLSTHFELYGGSSVDDHGKFVYVNYVDEIPGVNDADFTGRLNEIIAKYKIDFIFPAHDDVIVKLAEDKEKLKCEVIASPPETCVLTRSKLKTYDFFKDKIATPKVYESVESIDAKDFPIFLKPTASQGSKGTHLADNGEDIRFYLKKDPTLLMLENLPGKEYTVDCFTTRDGKLLFCEGRERKRISNGISVNSSSVNDGRIPGIAATINKSIKLRGAWFFQVKENHVGDLALMEIAPRIAGTMGLVRGKGVNLPLLSLFDRLGIDVDIFENDYDLEIDRALHNLYRHNISYKHVYLDYDDLVVFNGKVNPNVVAFVYQCHNKGVKVHLLTRHAGDIGQSLRDHHLENAFDEVTQIQAGGEKHKYITEKEAIFIDDSFAERKKIHNECHLPVFDSHMIESLMEKF